MTRPLTLMVFLAMMTLVLIPAVLAGISAEHKCEDYLCVEGTPVVFMAYVFNNLNRTIDVSNVFIVDKNTGDVLAFYNKQTFTIPSNEHIDLNLTVPARMPVEGYTHYYVPCINTSFEGDNFSKYVCSEVIRTLTVTPLDKVDCVVDSDCSEGYMCIPGRHICGELACRDDEAVLPHTCMPLSCGQYSVPKDHQCTRSTLQYWFAGGLIAAVLLLFVLFRPRDNKSRILSPDGKPGKTIRRRRRKR